MSDLDRRLDRLEELAAPPEAWPDPVDANRGRIARLAAGLPDMDEQEALTRASIAGVGLGIALSRRFMPDPTPRPGDDRLGEYQDLAPRERAIARRIEAHLRGPDRDDMAASLIREIRGEMGLAAG